MTLLCYFLLHNPSAILSAGQVTSIKVAWLFDYLNSTISLQWHYCKCGPPPPPWCTNILYCPYVRAEECKHAITQVTQVKTQNKVSNGIFYFFMNNRICLNICGELEQFLKEHNANNGTGTFYFCMHTNAHHKCFPQNFLTYGDPYNIDLVLNYMSRLPRFYLCWTCGHVSELATRMFVNTCCREVVCSIDWRYLQMCIRKAETEAQNVNKQKVWQTNRTKA